MRAMLGEEGTEQFTVETEVAGKLIGTQKVHDPFICTTVMIGWWDMVKALAQGAIFHGQLKVQVRLRGTEGAQRAILALDPEQLSSETWTILRGRFVQAVHEDAVCSKLEAKN